MLLLNESMTKSWCERLGLQFAWACLGACTGVGADVGPAVLTVGFGLVVEATEPFSMFFHLEDIVLEVCVVVLFVVSDGRDSCRFGLEVLMFHLHYVMIYGQLLNYG